MAKVTVGRRVLQPSRIYRQVADALGELIASGDFSPGDRLPTELDLAAS
jgi:DNA-binding FadR family transcriptional regulator